MLHLITVNAAAMSLSTLTISTVYPVTVNTAAVDTTTLLLSRWALQMGIFDGI